MSAELTHEQAADQIEAVALGIATGETAQAVAAHAARCEECAAPEAAMGWGRLVGRGAWSGPF